MSKKTKGKKKKSTNKARKTNKEQLKKQENLKVTEKQEEKKIKDTSKEKTNTTNKNSKAKDVKPKKKTTKKVDNKKKKEPQVSTEQALILSRVKSKVLKRKAVAIISIIAVIIFVSCAAFLSYYYLTKEQDRNRITEVQEYTPEIPEDKPVELTETNLKVSELQTENPDVKAWIKIEDTIIDYPVLQGTDNEYYLKHDYKKQYSKYGSIYIKPGCDINDVNSNLIIYGHNMKDEHMFNSLLKYTDKKYYEEHKTINITTENEEREYQIVAAFKSRVFYQNEQNVFRYYNYLNFENEQKYTEYVNNVNKAKLYDTGVTAEYGEQLITLITCEYSQENGRMVVVAKRIK